LDYKKPGDGIRADNFKKILGKRTKINIKKNTKIKLTYLI
jgi:sialic acid synthase SpsE